MPARAWRSQLCQSEAVYPGASPVSPAAADSPVPLQSETVPTWLPGRADRTRQIIIPPTTIDNLSADFEVTSMQTVKLATGDTIISEGEDGNTAFLIVSGSVEISVGR